MFLASCNTKIEHYILFHKSKSKLILRDTTDTIHVYSKLKNIEFGSIASSEGMIDSFYVPGDMSGPTISTGLDIGNMGDSLVVEIFSRVFRTALHSSIDA